MLIRRIKEINNLYILNFSPILINLYIVLLLILFYILSLNIIQKLYIMKLLQKRLIKIL